MGYNIIYVCIKNFNTKLTERKKQKKKKNHALSFNYETQLRHGGGAALWFYDVYTR